MPKIQSMQLMQQQKCNKKLKRQENFQELFSSIVEKAHPWTYRETLSCGVMYFENGVSPTSLAKLLVFYLTNEPKKMFHYPTRYYSTTRILSSLPYPTLPYPTRSWKTPPRQGLPLGPTEDLQGPQKGSFRPLKGPKYMIWMRPTQAHCV